MIFSSDDPKESLERIRQWLQDESDNHALALELPELQQHVERELEAAFISALTESIENVYLQEFEQLLMVMERLPARSSRRMRLCINEQLENNVMRFPMSLVIVAQDYLKCHFRSDLINTAFSLNLDYYTAEIQILLSQNDGFADRVLQYFETHLEYNANPLVTLNDHEKEDYQAILALIENCIEQEYDVFQHDHKRSSYPLLKKHILEFKLFRQKDTETEETLKYLGGQKHFTTSSIKNLSAYLNLLTDFDGPSIVNALFGPKNNVQQIHVPNLLRVVSALIQFRQDLHSDFYLELEQRLHEQLESGHHKKAYFITMMIARQSCIESTGKFKTYSHLYETIFCHSKVTSCAKKTTHLLTFLSEMVPYEPYGTLRSHLARPLPTTTQQRSLASDYYSLARTRMRDLEAATSDAASDSKISHSLFAKEDLVENEKQTEEVISKSVKQYKISGKIPANIYQLFNFKRPYFLNIFLPRLVKQSADDADVAVFLKNLKTALKIKEKL